MNPTEIQRARQAHEEWVAGLSPAERSEAHRLGVDTFVDPLSTSHAFEYAEEAMANSTASGDLIDKVAAEFHRSRAEIIEIIALVGGEHRQESGTGLREILSILLSSSDPRLCSAALLCLSGLASQTFSSEAQVAAEVGVSRQVLSKELGRLSKMLGDISLVFRRPEKARNAYSRAQRAKHWRRRPASQALASSPSCDGGDINPMIQQRRRRGGLQMAN
jgi:hypothetical protein